MVNFNSIKSLNSVQKVFVALSLISFLLSLLFPAYHLKGNSTDNDSNGIILLLLGWLPIFIAYFLSIIWFANPLYLLALYYFLKGSKISILFSFAALFTGLLFLRIDELLINENGDTAKIETFGLGYYCWIASFAFLFSGGVSGIVISKNKRFKLN